MKKVGDNKRKNKAKAAPVEFYVVAWSEADLDAGTHDCGTLSTLYSTMAKARKAVMDDIEVVAKDTMDCYDADDLVDVFGTKSPKVLAKQMVDFDRNGLIIWSGDGRKGYYYIAKYSTEFID